MTKGISAGDQLIENNEIIVNADADVECEVACPLLDGEYECTVYADEGDEWRRIGTRFRIENDGPATEFDLAVANDPGYWEANIPIGADGSIGTIADLSFPFSAIIAWDPPEDCREVLDPLVETWGEYKTRVGVDDLTDWYETFGTGGFPNDAPADLNDERIVQIKDIPEEGDENKVGPDETIDDADFPDMSQAAEDEGWITCTKFNGD